MGILGSLEPAPGRREEVTNKHYIATLGDADDLFVDAKRNRLYISCGDGVLDVLDAEGNAYKRIAHIPTVRGARTSLFVPELDRLLLAVRAEAGEPASIWVFRPTP